MQRLIEWRDGSASVMWGVCGRGAAVRRSAAGRRGEGRVRGEALAGTHARSYVPWCGCAGGRMVLNGFLCRLVSLRG